MVQYLQQEFSVTLYTDGDKIVSSVPVHNARINDIPDGIMIVGVIGS
jgi:hypothetical protein